MNFVKNCYRNLEVIKICITFVPDLETNHMVDVAQLVRVTDCGSEGRGFESHLPPLKAGCEVMPRIFFFCLFCLVSKLPSNKQKKRELRSSCFQLWNQGNGRVTSVVYSRTAFCDCGTPSVMSRVRDIQIPSSTPSFRYSVNSVRDTFKLWKRPRGERVGWALRSRESGK